MGYPTQKWGAGGLFNTVAHQNDDVKGDQHACCSVFAVLTAVVTYAIIKVEEAVLEITGFQPEIAITGK